MRSTLVGLGLAVVVVTACSPPVIDRVVPVTVPGPDTAPPVRVAVLPTPVASANTSLAGFRFVLDAGHGGAERGAPSPLGGNASEADLNLAVSLYLGGLLQASGAEVIQTRTADYAVLPGTDLAADLRARTDVANRHLADLFLSIHHNGSMDSMHNGIELYPKLRSPGASYAAAAAITRELGRLYPDFDSRSVAGNFAVLRRLEGEGALVECSYLSDRRLAPRLESITLARREAEAIFRGVAAWAASAGPAALIVVETGVARLRARTAVSWETGRIAAWRGADCRETTWQGRARVLEWSVPVVDPDSVSVELVEAGGSRRLFSWTAPRHRPVPQAPPWAFVVQGFSAPPESVALAVSASVPAVPSPPAATSLSAETVGAAASVGAAPGGSIAVMAWDASDPSRTLLAVEDLAPRRLVVVTRSAVPEVVHYFRSESGRRWAEEVARRLGVRRVTAGSHYLLNHTSMPALWIRWPGVPETTPGVPETTPRVPETTPAGTEAAPGGARR